jgi:hypothetical protein
MASGDSPTQALCDALRETLRNRISLLECEEKDLERRMRELEEFKWKLVGAACLAGALSGVGVNFLL